MTRRRSLAASAVVAALLLPLLPLAATPAAAATWTRPVPGTALVLLGDTGQVVAIAPDGTQKVVPTTGLGSPRGVTADAAGNIYIADTSNQRIVMVTPDGTQSDYIPAGHIQNPSAIAMDAWGTLYVSWQSFAVYGPNGILAVPPDPLHHYWKQLANDEELPPSGVAVDGGAATGEGAGYAYETVRSPSASGHVVRLGATSGRSVPSGFAVGQPWGVAVGADHTVYATYPGDNKVLAIGDDGDAPGPPLTLTAGLSYPWDVAVDNISGNIFVASGDNKSLVKFAANGTPISTTVMAGVPRAVAVVPPASPPQLNVQVPLPNTVYTPADNQPAANFWCAAAAGAVLKAGAAGCGASLDGGAPFANGPSGNLLDAGPGHHTLVVTATDTAGHSTAKTIPFTVAPMYRPTLDAPLGSYGIRNGSKPRIVFHCTKALAILKPGVAGCSASLDGGPPVASYSVMPDTQEGTHTIRLTATDVNGIQAITDTTYQISAPAPTITVTAPKDGVTYQQGSVPHLAYSCAANAPVVLRACAAYVDLQATANGAALLETAGEHDLWIGTDREDDINTIRQIHYAVTAGGPGPSLSATTPAQTGIRNGQDNDQGETYALGAVPAASFTCTAGAGAQLKAGATGCSITIDNGAAQAVGSALVGTLGQHTAVMTATQTDGQHITITRLYSVVGDPPPTTKLDVPAAGATYHVGSLPYTSYSCAASGGHTIIDCSATLDGTAIGSGSSFTAAAGQHTFTVTATQNGDLFSTVTHTFTVTSAPVVTMDSPADGAAYDASSTATADFACAPTTGRTISSCTGHLDTAPPIADGAPVPFTTGAHTFTAVATDNMGQSTTLIHHFTVVGTPPGAPAVTVTAPGNVSYDGAAIPKAAYTCAATAPRVIATCKGVLDTSTKIADGATLPVAGGQHTFTVTATDDGGKTATVTNHFTITGTVPPVPVVTLTTPADDAVYSANALPKLAFTCAPGAGHTLQNCAGVLDREQVFTSGAQLTNQNTYDGEHEFYVTALDDANQFTDVVYHFTVIGGAPTLSVTTPVEGAKYMVGTTPAASFTCTAGTGESVGHYGNDCTMSVDGASPLFSGFPLAGDVGPHTVVMTVVQNDKQRLSVTRHYTVVGPPSEAITSPTDGATYPTPSAPTLAFACTAASGGALKAGLAGCSASIDGGAAIASGAALTQRGGHALVVTATQVDGQTSSTTYHYAVFNGRPSVLISGPDDGAYFPVGSTPTASFSCVAGVGSALVDGLSGCYAIADGGSPLASGAALPAGPGSHTVLVYAADTDGSGWAEESHYSVAGPPPSVSISRPTDGQSFVVGAVPTVAFSCPPGAGGTLVAGLVGCSAVIDGGAPVASGVALASTIGKHSVTVTALQTDGQNTAVTRSYTVAAAGSTPPTTKPVIPPPTTTPPVTVPPVTVLPRCTIPKVKASMSVAAVQALLRKAHCRPGTAVKPKKKAGSQLVLGYLAVKKVVARTMVTMVHGHRQKKVVHVTSYRRLSAGTLLKAGTTVIPIYKLMPRRAA